MRTTAKIWADMTGTIAGLRSNQAHLKDDDDVFPTTPSHGHQHMKAALMFVDMNDFVHFMFNADDDDDESSAAVVLKEHARRRKSYGCKHAETLRRRRDELIRDALHDYFSKIAAAIDAYGGKIISFIGDAVLAAWFVKDPLDEHRTMVSATRMAAFCAENVAKHVHGRMMCARWTIAVKIMVSCGDVVIINTGVGLSENGALLLGQAIDDLYTLKRSMRPGRVAYSARGLHFLEDTHTITVEETRAWVMSSQSRSPLRDSLAARVSALVDDDGYALSLSCVGVGCARAVCAVTFFRFIVDRARERCGDIEYLRTIQRAVDVIQHGVLESVGVVVQIVVDEDGPACLCAFGLSQTRDHHASSRAVRCAHHVLAAFARDLPWFTTAVGISTGCVNIGPAMTRRELTLIGVPVILAARFADTALKTSAGRSSVHMLLDSTTRVEADEAMRDFAATTTTTRMDIRLKGFPSLVRAYAVDVAD
jgi:class 3 adenylate cyclase